MQVKQSALYSDETSFREFTRARENFQKSYMGRWVAHANVASENAIARSAEFSARRRADLSLSRSIVREKEKTPLEMLFDMKLSGDCIDVLKPTLKTIGFKVEPKDVQDSGLNDYYFTLASNNGIKRFLLQINPIFLDNPSQLNQLALSWVKDSFKLAKEFIPPINMFIFYKKTPADAFIKLTTQWTDHDDDYDIALINVEKILNLKDQDQGHRKNKLKNILGLDIPREVKYLTNDKKRELIDAIVDCGLNTLDNREALLADINPGYVAGLPTRRSTLDQIISDLNAMNRVPWLAGYEVPLKTWLETAVHRLRRNRRAKEQAVFQEALDTVTSTSEEIIREAQSISTNPG